jgi:phospholipase C/archaellum component FlaF (FlaF/FlaG flagellin family)
MMVMLTALGGVQGACRPAFAQQAHKPDLSQIQHFVFIVKENRTFDSYFGTFPGADGATTATLSTGQVIPLGHAPDVLPRDFGHNGSGVFTAMDWGRMDEFDISLGCSVYGDNLCLTQLQQEDIPNYFSYAGNFVLADHMFSSWAGASFPNHLYTVGAQSGGATGNPKNSRYDWGCDSFAGANVQVMDSNGDLSNQFPCFDFQTLGDTLAAAGISWTYYAPSQGQSGYEWSSFDAINHIRYGPLWTNVVPDTQFVTDAEAGSLPAVSWLVTGDSNSEHPPHSSCAGENWTVTQLNALMSGPDWNSTAVFVTWDDFGGLYDHLAPPSSPDEFNLGPRVPLLIISPFAIAGYISHTKYELSSFLRIVEERFGLPALTGRDSSASDMLDSFNFNQSPLPPLTLQTRSCPVASPPSLSFLPQQVGTPSPAKTVTVTNFGTSSLTMGSIEISGDFSAASSCGATVAPGRNCSVSVTFLPSAGGNRTGTLTINDSDPGSPQVVSLSGTGSNVTLTSSLLTFGAQIVSTSTAKSVTLTNAGSTRLSLSSIVASGDYTEVNTCHAGVSPGGKCSIKVSFTPSTPGTRFGTVTITDSDGSSPQVLSLTGIGTYLTASPPKLTFGSQLVGTTSAPQNVTLTNNGSTVLNISNVAVVGKYVQPILDFSQTNTCGSSLGPGNSCTFSVEFSPQIAGTLKADVAIFSSEAATTPLTRTVSGTGVGTRR